MCSYLYRLQIEQQYVKYLSILQKLKINLNPSEYKWLGAGTYNLAVHYYGEKRYAMALPMLEFVVVMTQLWMEASGCDCILKSLKEVYLKARK